MEPVKAPFRPGFGRPTAVVRDINDSLGKLPPQSLDLEEAILGALMLERNALSKVIEFLQVEHFYKEQHKEIYQAIRELFKAGSAVDMRTVVMQLRETGKLEIVGGSFVVAELTSKVSSASNIEYHARKVVELAIKRKLIEVASQIHHDAYEDTTDVFDLLDKTEQSVFEISDSNLRKNYDSMASLMKQAYQEIKEKKEHKDGLTGIPTGFSDLDRLTSGWQRSDLIIIAARPGMGKTAFVVSALRNAAVDYKKPVALFSMEMSSVQLVMRLMSAESELESDKIRKGKLRDDEMQQLISKTSDLSKAPIFIDDTPALTILELRAKCRRLKAEHKVELIIIDYLQLMKGDAGGNREQEIASISRSLKGIAKELNVPVIAVSQLSRSVETRGGDKRPQLSDLRESGAIEQDADIVSFLYRPEYYKIDDDGQGNSTKGMAEFIVAKHRNGSTANIQLKFLGQFTKFMDWTGTIGLPHAIVEEPKSTIMGSKMNKEKSFDDFPVDKPKFPGDPPRFNPQKPGGKKDSGDEEAPF